MNRDFLINNLVAGVYTNTDKYKTQFTENWKIHYDNLPLIYDINKGKINENMEHLRHRFIESGKRYWLFMDHDISFNDNQVIEIALKTMKEKDLALCSVYQTPDKKIIKKTDQGNLKFAFITWSAGYFMLIDSEKVGLLPFDMNLPTTHGSMCDLAFSMNVIVNNGLIGIAPALILHKEGGYSPEVKIFKINKKTQPQVDKTVKEFFKRLDHKYMYGMPSIELVFLGSGKIDYNETVGGQYLKWKYPDIYKEVVARPNYANVISKNGFTDKINS